MGREVARMISKHKEEGVPSLEEIEARYRAQGPLFATLQESFEKAVDRFRPLLVTLAQHDIWPLDAFSFVRPGGTRDPIITSVVEFLMIEAAGSFMSEFPSPQDTAEFLITDFLGPLRYREQSHAQEKVGKERPDLFPFFRQANEAEKLKGQAASIKQNQRWALNDAISQSKLPEGRRLMASPGWYCKARLNEQNPLVGKKGTYFRQCWTYVSNAQEAIEYILSGQEVCNQMRFDPQASFFKCIGEAKKEDPAYQHFVASGSYHPEKKPFICVTQDRSILETIPVNGNLLIQIETDRAFSLFLNLTSMAEKECGIPFVINPIEVVKAERFDSHGELQEVLHFSWIDEGCKLRVDAIDSGQKTRAVYLYVFSEEHRSYQLFRKCLPTEEEGIILKRNLPPWADVRRRILKLPIPDLYSPILNYSFP